MKKITIGSAVALISTNAFAVNISSYMPDTTGSTSILGSDLSYSVAGQANYLYGLDNVKSGWQNSELTTRVSTMNSVDSVNVSGLLNLGSASKPFSNNYEFDVTGEANFYHKNHTVIAGYDRWLIDSIFGGVHKSEIDTNFTVNPLGARLNSTTAYAGYGITTSELDLAFKVDSDHNFGVTFNKTLGAGEIQALFTDYYNEFGGYALFNSFITDNSLLSVGAGYLNRNVAYSIASSTVLSHGFSANGNVTGYGSEGRATAGIEYAYHNVAFYAEGGLEFGNYEHKDRDTFFAVGTKITF